LATRRSKAQNIYEDEVDHLEDDDQEDADNGTEGAQPPSSGKRSTTAAEDDTPTDDAADEEVARDPVARAVAQAEARMRHKFKPLRAELDQLKKIVGNAKGAEETIRTLRMENVFLRLAADTFHDSAAAFKLADLSKVEVGEDGTITGMEDVVDQLADSHPYLIRQPDTVDDDTWDTPDLPSGRPMNGQRKGQGKADPSEAALIRKYPALQRRRGW